jgi:hypothetical protein
VTFSNDSRKYNPYAFTEHGILILSSVLNSDRAINIQVMRIRVNDIIIVLNNLIEQPPKPKKIGFTAEK